MRTLLLVVLSTFLGGCVYTQPSLPYSYSRYTIVAPTPVYPRYESPRLTPRFHYFEEHPHPHFYFSPRSRHYW